IAQSGSALWGRHTLAQLIIGKGYDLVAAGAPIVEVNDVGIAFDGGLSTLTIAPHSFTLGLGSFERRALDAQSIAVRLPALSPTSPTGLFDATVAAVQHGGRSGCAGVEDLVCSATGASGCTGAVEPACTSAVTAIAASLEAGFVPANPLDLTLT